MSPRRTAPRRPATLALGGVLRLALVSSLAPAAAMAHPADAPDTTRVAHDRIHLKATARVPGAEGLALLRPIASPFGVAVSRDGHLRLEAQISSQGLPTPAALGDYTAYVVWVANTDLTAEARLTALDKAGRGAGEVSRNKFTIFVSAERNADVRRRKGPVVLRGISPSSYMQNMLSEPLTNGGMPTW